VGKQADDASDSSAEVVPRDETSRRTRGAGRLGGLLVPEELFPGDECNDPDDQEHEEQHFGNHGGGAGETAEAEDGSDDGNYEEYKGPVEHGFGWLVVW